MTLEVVNYGHPVLRRSGKPIESITPEVRQLIDDMFETMEAYRGIGLAAQQVARELQLTVIDVREVTDRPSWIEVNGERKEIEEFMPMVLINPELSPVGPPEEGGEGCLSFPEVYAEISRPGIVDVKALDRNGTALEFRCGGLLARAVQHETDHLNGILFIDRMSSETKQDLQPELDAIQDETRQKLRTRQQPV
jgi:peptide deformylase